MVRLAPPLVTSFAIVQLLTAARASAGPINVLLASDPSTPCVVINQWHWGQLPTSHVVCMDDDRDGDGPLTDSSAGNFGGGVSWMVVQMGSTTATPTFTTLAGPPIFLSGGSIDDTFSTRPLMPDIPTATPTFTGQPIPLFWTTGATSGDESAVAGPQDLQLNPIPTFDRLDPLNPFDPLDPLNPFDPLDPLNPFDPLDPLNPMTPTPEPGSLLLFGTGLLVAWRALQR